MPTGVYKRTKKLVFSEEHKRRISEALKGNKNCLGRKMSRESREKISKAHKGRPNWKKGMVFLSKKVCPECGSKFQPKHRYKIYCSKECYIENKKKNIPGGLKKWWLYLKGRSGERCHNWKGGWITSNGYHHMLINNKKVLKHRLVMEEHLGRKLSETETVHHIDGDKLNNNIDNLRLFQSKSEHAKFHSNVRRITEHEL